MNKDGLMKEKFDIALSEIQGRSLLTSADIRMLHALLDAAIKDFQEDIKANAFKVLKNEELNND